MTDNLFEQGTIPSNSIGISYVPTTSDSPDSEVLVNGELTFGGLDSDKYSGEITFAPITSTSPASNYWGIDQKVTYGDDTLILDTTAGIVDTGTTLIYLASDAFSAYQQATGASLDESTGLLKLTSDQYDNLQSLFFEINGTTFELTKNAQIWPRSLNSTLGGDEDAIYLVAADNGTDSGSGLDFINGFTWCKYYYIIFMISLQDFYYKCLSRLPHPEYWHVDAGGRGAGRRKEREALYFLPSLSLFASVAYSDFPEMNNF